MFGNVAIVVGGRFGADCIQNGRTKGNIMDMGGSNGSKGLKMNVCKTKVIFEIQVQETVQHLCAECRKGIVEIQYNEKQVKNRCI